MQLTVSKSETLISLHLEQALFKVLAVVTDKVKPGF
jgi:hypothetical protein